MSAYQEEIMAWRVKRKARLLAEDGWLSIVAKGLLFEGRNRIGSDPASEVVLPATSPVHVATAWLEQGKVRLEDAKGDAIEAHSEIWTLGTLRFELLRRKSEIYARVKDKESAARVSFEGVPYFAIQEKWRIVAKLEPYTPHKVIELDYEGGHAERYESPGRAVFEIDGVHHGVDPVFDRGTERLYLLFRDATFRDSTYGAGRFLYAPLPKNGEVVLDFNQAFNPPCALTPFASCPLTPAQNKLDLRIEAGEKRL